jgi:hypothetical protein
MSRIGSQGFVDDGSSNLSVAGTFQATRTVPGAMLQATLTGDTNVLAQPGMYNYKGPNVQATLPVASSFPGSMFIFAPYFAGARASGGGVNIILSGTAVADQWGNTSVFYSQQSGSHGGTGVSRGVNLTTATSGSVGLVSDGILWNVMFQSGSLTIA